MLRGTHRNCYFTGVWRTNSFILEESVALSCWAQTAYVPMASDEGSLLGLLGQSVLLQRLQLPHWPFSTGANLKNADMISRLKALQWAPYCPRSQGKMQCTECLDGLGPVPGPRDRKNKTVGTAVLTFNLVKETGIK